MKLLLSKFILFLTFICHPFYANAQINLDWAVSIGSSNSEISEDMIMDNNGYIYVTGSFTGTTDFDPSSSSYNLSSNTSTNSDVFLAKYDSSNNLIWVISFGGSLSDQGYRIQFDMNGNIVISGIFYNTCDFDPSSSTYNLTSVGKGDIFFARYSPSGTFMNAFSFGGKNNSFYNDFLFGFRIDNNNNIYATGVFSDTIDFNPGSGVNIINAFTASSIFVAKYTITGGYIWAKVVINNSGSNNIGVRDIELDGIGNFYLTGGFRGTFDFDPSSTTSNFTSIGGIDMYLSKYDTSGNYIWCYGLGGTAPSSPDEGVSLKMDNSGNVLLCGSMGNTLDFDFSSGIYNLSLNGTGDCFIAKYSSNANLVWAINFGGNASNVSPFKMIRKNNDIFVVGWFSGTIDVDPTSSIVNINSVGIVDGFINKFDLSGNYQSNLHVGGTNLDIIRSIEVYQDNIYCTGIYSNVTIDMDPSSSRYNLSNSGSFDIFLAKYNNLTLLPINEFFVTSNCNEKNNSMLLSFNTDKEYVKYELEQSKDGINFELIESFVNPKNNINFSIDNLFLEYQLRLKAISLNGLVDYFYPEVSNCQNKFLVNMFPNPCFESFNLEISFNGIETLKFIEIIDSKGQIISTLNFDKKIQQFDSFLIDTIDLESGFYFLKLNFKNSHKYIKFIKT